MCKNDFVRNLLNTHPDYSPAEAEAACLIDCVRRCDQSRQGKSARGDEPVKAVTPAVAPSPWNHRAGSLAQRVLLVLITADLRVANARLVAFERPLAQLLRHVFARRDADGGWQFDSFFEGDALANCYIYIGFEAGNPLHNLEWLIAEARLALLPVERDADVKLLRPALPDGTTLISSLLAQPAIGVALGALQGSSVPASPAKRIWAIEHECEKDRVRQARAIRALAEDDGFAAALFVAAPEELERAQRALRAHGISRAAFKQLAKAIRARFVDASFVQQRLALRQASGTQERIR